MLDTMSAEEYGLHLADYVMDPWGERRADLRAAYTTAMVAWVNGNKKTKVTDFMPYEPKEIEEHSTAGLMAFIGAVNG